MTIPQLKNFPILTTKAPNLPIAPTEYSQEYIDRVLNALRLYFNQLDNFTSGVSGNLGGSYIKFPYGAFHTDTVTTLSANITNVSTTPISVASTVGYPSSGAILIGTEIITYTTTTATTFDGTVTRGAYSTTKAAHTAGAAISAVQGTTAGTRTPVYLNITDYSSGVILASANTSKIYFQYSGLYNIQFSAQFSSANASPDNVTVWGALNSNDIPDSAGIITVPNIHGGVFGAIVAGWNFYVQVVAGDELELYWATDSGDSVIMTYPSGTSPVHPASPGMIVTATFVSAAQ